MRIKIPQGIFRGALITIGIYAVVSFALERPTSPITSRISNVKPELTDASRLDNSNRFSKRNRGEGIFQTVCSNTAGFKNIWLTLQVESFIWANKTLDSTRANASEKPGYFPFGEMASEIGILNFASLLVESRVLSYTRNHWFQFGNAVLGLKATLPHNKELRFQGAGVEVKYIWNSPGDTFPSLAGYRAGATGFAPEGYIVDGSNLQFKCIYDLDFMKRYSWLPLKFSANAGMRIPFKKAIYVAPQFLFNTGLLYSDLGFDVFAEYSLEAFNNFSGPKPFIDLGHPKTEVYFLENPMYVSLGGRIRYTNGMTLFACVPFLLSSNVGSAMTQADKKTLNDARKPEDRFYEEHTRGLTDPFDPWFAKWKIVAAISFPMIYKQTGTEMMRTFLLLKNRKEKQKIDIDERLRALDGNNDSLATDADKRRRLEEIQKRRDQINMQE
jgi:hypothetical protein